MFKDTVDKIFISVADALIWTGKKTGMTYNEVNVIIYYLLIPLSWTVMLDCMLRFPVSTTILLCVWAGIFIATHDRFGEWCDKVFMRSVDFLNRFNRWGGNYTLNSVIICVLIPVIVYGILLWLLANP